MCPVRCSAAAFRAGLGSGRRRAIGRLRCAAARAQCAPTVRGLRRLRRRVPRAAARSRCAASSRWWIAAQLQGSRRVRRRLPGGRASPVARGTAVESRRRAAGGREFRDERPRALHRGRARRPRADQERGERGEGRGGAHRERCARRDAGGRRQTAPMTRRRRGHRGLAGRPGLSAGLEALSARSSLRRARAGHARRHRAKVSAPQDPVRRAAARCRSTAISGCGRVEGERCSRCGSRSSRRPGCACAPASAWTASRARAG